MYFATSILPACLKRSPKIVFARMQKMKMTGSHQMLMPLMATPLIASAASDLV